MVVSFAMGALSVQFYDVHEDGTEVAHTDNYGAYSATVTNCAPAALAGAPLRSWNGSLEW